MWALMAGTQSDWEAVVYAVWDWIISVNNGSGLDAEDLMSAMEHVGAGCPADLDEDGNRIPSPVD